MVGLPYIQFAADSLAEWYFKTFASGAKCGFKQLPGTVLASCMDPHIFL